MPFLSESEIELLGFKSVGSNVLLSNKASFYNCSNITIGDNVRIDDFVVISAGEGGVVIGNYIHIAVYSSLIGAGKIQIDDFANISSRVSVYSSNDDYSGDFMTNPMVPAFATNVQHSPVLIGMHSIIGSGSVVLPGVVLEAGVAVGALSLVREKCESFFVYAGVPAKKIKKRSKGLLTLEKKIKSTF